MKLEVFILEGQRIDQKRKKGWWREGEMRKRRRDSEKRCRKNRERAKRKRQKGVEKTIEEEEEEHHHYLPLLVVQLPQGTAVLFLRHEFPTIFCSKVLQK